MLTQRLLLHHVGCLTESIEESLNNYVHILGFKQSSKIITIASQQVKICFVETIPGVFIELIEPIGKNPTLKKIIDSKNPYYHIGYKVKDLPHVIEELQLEGFYLVNRFFSEAFNNKECAFLYSQEMHLIEIIED